MNTQIYEEATDWLIKHREADLSPQEKQEFDAWLRESPQHVRAYLEMSAVWEDVAAPDPSWNPTSDQLIAHARSEGNIYPLADTARITGGASHPRRLLAALEERGRGAEELFLPVQVTGEGRGPRGGKGEIPLPPRVRGERLRLRSFTLAALFLVALMGATTWYSLDRNTYATDIGEQRSIDLADGSTVQLNSRSRIRVRYTDGQRDVDLLEGQALFRAGPQRSATLHRSQRNGQHPRHWHGIRCLPEADWHRGHGCRRQSRGSCEHSLQVGAAGGICPAGRLKLLRELPPAPLHPISPFRREQHPRPHRTPR